MLAAARLLPPADAGRPTPLPGLAACLARPAAGAGVASRPGTFFRLQASLDARGALAAQHLVVGAGGQPRAGTDLPAEASASGPVQGVVVVTADDGRQSTIRLVGVAAACTAPVYATDSIVRRAILDPADGGILFHLLSRAQRSDLGTWRLAPGDPNPTRVLEPLPATLGLGAVWGTDLRLDSDGRLLAVQSCVERGCVTRVVDLGAPSLPAMVIRGARQGPMLGFTGGRLVTWAVCDGFPCAVLAWDAAAATPTELVTSAGAAGMTGDGRLLVAITGDGGGQALLVDLIGGAVRPLHGLAAGERPVATGGLAGQGLELEPDQLVVAQRAGDPHAVRLTAAGEVVP